MAVVAGGREVRCRCELVPAGRGGKGMWTVGREAAGIKRSPDGTGVECELQHTGRRREVAILIRDARPAARRGIRPRSACRRHWEVHRDGLSFGM